MAMQLVSNEQAQQMIDRLNAASDAESFCSAAMAAYRSLPVQQRAEMRAAMAAHANRLAT